MDSHTSYDEFFRRLADLFDQLKAKGHGSVFLVQKRLSYSQDLSASSPANLFPDLRPSRPMPVLIRATNGKSTRHRDEKIKISTVVDADALEGFYARYADICKSGMAALKPRDRSKKKAKARKKKGGFSTTLP
ncbi:Signal recognition particle subunit srp14 [Colletotrichum trifolii]|uniref:Signal recognition particle subunit SRP14 n=1 Tax=Colletotrichum trifolii TaxID=5466 RepID=A0A4R8PQV2_COLTR|nr:Signal recognition particle subunit srp14 [Colletotrichum trifolii]